MAVALAAAAPAVAAACLRPKTGAARRGAAVCQPLRLRLSSMSDAKGSSLSPAAHAVRHVQLLWGMHGQGLVHCRHV